jgi:phosphoribosyl-AMP cyclohydrolase
MSKNESLRREVVVQGALFRLVPLIFWYDKTRYETRDQGASSSDGYQYKLLDITMDCDKEVLHIGLKISQGWPYIM